MSINSRSSRTATLVFTGLFLFGAAEASAQRFRANLRFGADFGGDKVVTFQYEDGSTPDVVAGSGVFLGVGGVAEVFRSKGHGVDAQANVGVKYRTIPPASNQSADWIRIPVEGLLMYNAPRFRLGGGVAAHLANTLSASGAVLNDKVTFKPEPGFIGQAEWKLPRVTFDVRYTAMKYTVESGGSGKVNANSIGAGMSYWFGQPIVQRVK